MKRWCPIGLLLWLWGLFSVVSLVLFAFVGIVPWVTFDGSSAAGNFRALVLIAFYVGGIFAAAIVAAECSKSKW